MSKYINSSLYTVYTGVHARMSSQYIASGVGIKSKPNPNPGKLYECIFCNFDGYYRFGMGVL